MKQKIRDFMAILIIQLIFTLPFYTVNVYSLTISNVRIAKVSSNSATIEWETDNISNGRVKYGKTASLGFTQRHDNFIGNHSVALFNGIDSDTNYFFAVESTDLAGNNAIDNNSNSFYAFHTSDITPPSQVAGLRLASATSSSISIIWDSVNIGDFSHYIVYRDRTPIGNSTSSTFNDTGLETNKEHNYKISAVDTSGNEGPQSDTLIASTSAVDSIAPVISNLDILGITDTTARVTWLTNENATTIAIYGINKTDKIKSSNEFELNHTIVIDGLAKNSQVILVAKSCDASNNCANLSQNFTAGKDTKIPFINLSIPRFFNRKFMDIIGSTEPFSSVTLFINNMNIPRRSLSNNEIGASGKFAFSQIQLEQNNVIKIVMVDKSGNKNQKIFETSLDMQDPIVQLNEIPSIVSKANLSIIGSTNEPATIKVFVETNINESSAPSKITGLNATKIGPNSAEMRWDESKDKDFSHYVVYREDIGSIAITKPANFNLYIDALVDSGKSYTYRVSAVSIFGKEGPKSDPLTVSTLKNGSVLNLKPPEVDALEDFRKPLMIVNVSSPFSFGIKLNKGDGTYFIKLIFEDRAENAVIFERSVTLDTKKPEVKILSPPSGAFIFENVANEVDIVGTTKPNARVHLFVDRTPFSLFNNSFEISGLPNEVQNLPEAQLDAKCRSSVSASFCRTGADFSVDADSQGNFRFENVDMTVIFGGAARLTEVPPQDFRDTVLNQEAQESKRVVLVVIATDQTGQRGTATQTVRIGTCWSGNQSWEVIPLNQHQYPTFLSTERFAEGIETIYFYFNYTYLGRGTNARITGISLSKACGTKELLDPRFNISCQVLPSGDTPTKLGSSKTISYSAIPLSRFPGMDKFLENDWKVFLKAINKELTFPFKVRIAYEHDVINGEGKSVPVRETQTLCEQVTYVVDDAIIDPRKVLPDWLLFDFVDFLKESVDTITELQQKIDTLINYVAIGCLGSIFANGVIKIWRNWMELWDEKLFALKEITFSLDTEQKSQECKDLTKAVKDAYGSLKLKYFSDADLKKCFPSSASAWETEEKVYKLQRWTCDRIFGHSSPAGWTEGVGDEELHRTITSEKTCASDGDVRGQRIRVESCTDIAGRYLDISKPKSDIPFDKKCFIVNLDPANTQKPFIYTFAEQQDQDPSLTANGIYKLTSYERSFIKDRRDIYAIKGSDNIYMTYQPQTCAQLCGFKQEEGTATSIETSPSVVQQYEWDKDKKEFVTVQEFRKRQAAKNKEVQQPESAKTNTKIASCTTVNQCRDWLGRSSSKAEGISIFRGENEKPLQIQNYKIDFKGYSSNCFYDNSPGGPEIISKTDPNTRMQCCCVNGQASQFKTLYYQPNDVDAKLEEKLPRNQPVHKSKKAAEVIGVGTTQLTAPSGYDDMEFSYRYSRIGYLGKKYNPNRYISGRDQSACLGQNEPISLIAGREREVVMLEPARQDTVVLWPCLYLTGVNQRLQRIKVIANAMSNCLIQVRTSGRADTGVCKELFTQHLCDAIWQGIRFFVDGCTPDYLGPGNPDEKEGKWLEGAQLGMKGIFQGIAESQSEIAQDYSNAKLNDFLGAGEESVARKVCLAAFGYDWEVNAKNLIDAAYSAPFASLVQAVTRSREFLTVDPVTKRPKYEYRTSWIINPGCDLERYDVQLACVTKKELDKYPNQISCGSIGSGSVGYTGRAGEISSGYNQCDCLELSQEQAESFASGSRIKQNSLEDKSLSRVIESQRRFDHVKITLRPDRRIGPGSRTGFDARTNCFPQGFEEGVFYFPIIDKTARDILDCTVDASTGIFNCGSGTDFFSRKGIAEVIEIKINDKRADEFKDAEAGKPLDIILKIRKTGMDKCARVTLSDTSPMHEFIRENATTEVRFVTPTLNIAGREKDVEAPKGVVVRLLEQQNNEPVDISVQFQGNTPQQGQSAVDTSFSLSDDNDMIFVEGISDKLMPTTDFRKLLEQRNTPNEIIVEKNRAKIKIDSNAVLNQPRTAGLPYTNGGRITINPSRQTTQLQGSQRKTVTVELFETKESDPNDCNLGDPLFKKDYSFVVSAKSSTSQTTGPLIDFPDFLVDNKKITIARKGNFVTIRAKVVDAFQVGSVDLGLVGPDGNNVEVQKFDPQGDLFIFKFDTTKAPFAGVYTGTIKAKSKKADRPEASREFKLEIQCGDEANGYGKCQDSCLFEKLIKTGFQCKRDFLEDGETIQPCCRVQ